MLLHDSQERVEVGTPQAASLSAPWDSSPSGSLLRSSKRQRVSLSGSRSRRTGSPETFSGRSTAAYKNWLQDIQLTDATHQYIPFVDKKVAESFDGVWAIGKVQCRHQGIMLYAQCAIQQQSCPTKVSLFRLFGLMTLTSSATFLAC